MSKEGLHQKFDVSEVEAEMKAKKEAAERQKGLAHDSKTEMKKPEDIPELSSDLLVEDTEEEKLAEARKNIELAQGTGEVELTEEDLELEEETN